jgi:hypothetical protein
LWTPLLRWLSGGDYDFAARAASWPIREALAACVLKLETKAIEQYRHEVLVWAIQAPFLERGSSRRPPALPAILRRRNRVDT